MRGINLTAHPHLPDSGAGADWMGLGTQLALGTLFGLAVGYALKKMIRLSLILLAVALTFLIVVGRLGFVTVHWEVIESAYEQGLASGGLVAVRDAISAWFTSNLPVAGSFSLGLLVGLARG